ncbi:MAG: UDP-N-acetylenolpyruvoylglucosamine reductase [Parcubacteria group bacterium GW2011_GWE2_37_8]|nr:MAG: UDP-N-acetylenolpyruvoylglucosamine reductase [Candidatus Moranbacteria bacterium GW2011_GWF2_37_7]KKQ42447.1 MAG: UDP-N-acetylenolpyruvoylglucosamine reductase [Parcubacteria group bacterium GW2011_GWE2_37_8]
MNIKSVSDFKENVLLAPLTTFKIGGPARYFAEVASESDLLSSFDVAKNMNLPVFVLGGGSNVLIADSGFSGLVVRNRTIGMEIIKEEQFGGQGVALRVFSGESLARLVSFALQNSFSGLEWAAGIPGTVGGAVRGNAGAFGRSASDLILEVEAYDMSVGKKIVLSSQDCDFRYRQSIFKRDPNLIILSVKINLEVRDKKTIQSKMIENVKIRAKSEHGIKNSAGCFFKNIEWSGVDKEKLKNILPEIETVENKYKLPAGFLIEKAGLSGKFEGNAKIHSGHCNYIINENSAKADDVKKLSDLCKKIVAEKYGIDLEPEVQLVGF